MSFTVPPFTAIYFSAPRAEADGMRCRTLDDAPGYLKPERCTWDTPFSG